MGDVLQFAGVMGVIATSVVSVVGGVAWAIRHARGGSPGHADELHALRVRVAQLEQAVDVVAVEVERVGEAQRYTERMVAPGPAAARTRAE